MQLKNITKLGDLILEGSYGILPPGDSYNENLPIKFIRATEMKPDLDFEQDDVLRVEEQYYKNKRAQVKLNDILLAVKGATIASDKCVSYVENEVENAIVNGSIFRFQVKDFINPKYIAYMLSLEIIKKQMRFNLIANNAVDYLDRPLINELLIPMPHEKVQAQIVQRLDNATYIKKQKIFDANEIYSKIDGFIAKKIGFEFPKQELKNAFGISVSSLENRLDPHFYLPNFKGLLNNIRKTKNAKLGDLVTFSKETWNQKDGFENEFPYIEISEIDLSSGKINNVSFVPVTEAPSRAKMVIRENDIIVSTTRPHRGAISFIDKSKDGYIASTGFAILRDLKTDEVSKEYIFYILRTQICLLQMLQRSSGGSYPAITAEELRNIYIPIPDREIQQEIVNDIKAFILQAQQLKNEAQAEFIKTKQEIETMLMNVRD